MQTAHGTPMNPRSALLYSYLAQEQTGIRSWATDLDVQANYPRLQAALSKLEQGQVQAVTVDGAPVALTPVNLENLIRDLQALMRRLPSARSK